MKKVLIVIIAVAGLAASLTSCKSHETCPAYGQVESTNTDING